MHALENPFNGMQVKCQFVSLFGTILFCPLGCIHHSLKSGWHIILKILTDFHVQNVQRAAYEFNLQFFKKKLFSPNFFHSLVESK